MSEEPAMTAVIKENWKAAVVLAPFFGLLIALFFVDPIAQDSHYHGFADDRFFLIPFFQNVITNLIFIFVGYYAAVAVDFKKYSRLENLYLLTLVAGVFFTGFGSIYYHLHPDTETLFWDRLPMSLGFAGFTSWILSKTIFLNAKEKKVDLYFYIFLMTLSLGSVLYWSYTETILRGDLRLYYIAQFGSILTTLLVVILYEKDLYPKKSCISLFIFYVLAKIFEVFDRQVYELTNYFVSGHALKHLLAGFGCFLFLYYLKRRL
jgi:hypothetical protein